jgi:uncharacterized protein (DUF58 family)
VLTGRGWAVAATGLLLWVGARLVGSDDLHIVAVGITSLPGLAFLFVRWSRTRLRASRRLSLRRVPAGSRVNVTLEIQNLGRAPTSLLMLEDRLPRALGRAARAVLDGLRGRTRQSVSYTLVCGRRGRYPIGPLIASVTDPFGLARRRVAFPETHELIVYPEIEDLRAVPRARSVGGSGQVSARLLHRTGEEFYTMRPYELGDDLRRIHWPSTARSGNLMIRQDETGRQASASIYLDTRAFGGPGAAFERAVSAAASIGSLYLREGLDLRLATTDMAPRPVTAEAFLETLAQVAPSSQRSSTGAMARLRDRAGTGSSLVAVLPVPAQDELTELLSATRDHGHRLMVLLVDESDDDRVRATRIAVARAGWDTVVLPLGKRLRDVWTLRAARPTATAASS